MRISDWSSDVCSSDLRAGQLCGVSVIPPRPGRQAGCAPVPSDSEARRTGRARRLPTRPVDRGRLAFERAALARPRSEEHTSELQSLMRISYAVFCLKKKNRQRDTQEQIYSEKEINDM